MAEDPFPCEALELAVASMRNGEEADVEVRDVSFAFGEAGLPGIVPPGAVVTYHVTLHDFTDGVANYELDDAAKLARAEALKARGNRAFKAGALRKARRMYDDVEAITSLAEGAAAEESAALKELGTSVTLNLAAIALREGDNKKCAALCTKVRLLAARLATGPSKRQSCVRAALTRCPPEAVQVLEKQPDSVKALFRRSTARTNLGDLIEASQDLENALLLEPGNAELMRAQKRLRQLRRQADKKDSKLYGARSRSRRLRSSYACAPRS